MIYGMEVSPVRHVIWIFVLACSLGYDFIYNDGYYFQLTINEIQSVWRMITSSVLGFF